jgi:hypothetical protein
MPVARSDNRRATIIGIVGVIVGTVMIVGVLIASNLGGGDTTQSSKTTFDVGLAKDRAESIARDGPIGFNDTAGVSRPIFVQHSGDDPTTGWIAFDAVTGGNCVVTWHQDTHDFTDCTGRHISADGDDLRHYPVEVKDDHVIVNLSLDATTTTTSP